MELKLKSTAAGDTIKLIDDVLYLFTIAANQPFYTSDNVQPGAAGDLRKKWKMTGPFTAAVSANSSVMGELYLCIQNHLQKIYRQTNDIEAVTLTFSNSMLEVVPMLSGIRLIKRCIN